jgi:hypothetical protein
MRPKEIQAQSLPQQRTDGDAGAGNTNTETALIVFGEQR